ncbi:MAG: SDR family oxidoreductase [Cyclobacteriaceae bacterium]|nr:SDR family oxidoreductase [Cyclobacteriaceae bacterium]
MNKVVLITGASSGIGLAIATYLAQKGHIIYGASRSAPASVHFRAIQIDVTNQESVQHAIGQIMEKEGRIDVLINNAGVGSVGALEKTPMEDIKKSFEVNTFGVVRLCQAVLPHMRAQGAGLIINMSTLGSAIGLPFRSFYSASKGAMSLITESLRLETEAFGIKACTIHPGEVRTNIGEHRIVSTGRNDETYGTAMGKSLDALTEALLHGKDPALFGPFIEKLIHAKKVKRSYRIGHFQELLGVWLKGILPYYIYEWILRQYFKSEN